MVPSSISNDGIFPELNHPAIGGTPISGNPHISTNNYVYRDKLSEGYNP